MLALVLVPAACGADRGVDVVAGPSAATASARADTDAYHPDLIAYLTRHQIGGQADAIPAPVSLDEAMRTSTVVLLAEVEDAADTPDFVDEGVRPRPRPTNLLDGTGVILRPIEILQGGLQPGLDRVGVAFCCANSADLVAAHAPASTLPRGRAIWFLDWGGAGRQFWGDPPPPTARERGIYWLSHFSAVFAQGASGVVAPMFDLDAFQPPSVKDEGEAFATLGALAQWIRDNRQRMEPERARFFASPSPGPV